MGTSTSKASGFTIIETVLFLAVSGALIVGMVAGAGASLNIQRYHDATQSFKALLQKQYADLSSVQNGRTNNWTCDATATAVEGGDVFRGQSNCMVVGKYMRIAGSDISIYTVLAAQTGTLPPTGANDIASLRTNYTLNASQAEVDNSTMDWGTELAWAKDGSITDGRAVRTPRAVGILFIRSPDSGLVYTFTSDTVPAKDAILPAALTAMLAGGNVVPGQAARTLCIASSGLAVVSDQAIYINAYASAASAIEVRSNSLAGVTSQC